MLSRRAFLSHLGLGIAALNLPVWARNGIALAASPLSATSLKLNPPDENGLMLPDGFTSRILARSGQVVKNHIWHAAPDGGDVFAIDETRWVYVSNAELEDGQGGVSALVFQDGAVTDSYSILSGTTRNCAGGKYLNSWLSCEEHEDGLVWQCDPLGKKEAVPLPALGTFMHEAAAYDPLQKILYLTEDRADGLFYRYILGNSDLASGNGTLEAATLSDGKLIWQKVPRPNGGAADPTRYQLADGFIFNGGEGCAYQDGTVYFSTKGDNKIWAYNTRNNSIHKVYDFAYTPTPVLSGVDNVTIAPNGQVLVAEDGGNNELVTLSKEGFATPLLRLIGHDESELCGPAFSPDKTRLYFSSQRGAEGESTDGVTFEVRGNFAAL